jgi:hypothetical protein
MCAGGPPQEFFAPGTIACPRETRRRGHPFASQNYSWAPALGPQARQILAWGIAPMGWATIGRPSPGLVGGEQTAVHSNSRE